MSYAIIRNEKLTRARAIGVYKHNERKTKNHSNKNIDTSKSNLNYYLKKNELSYIKEFDKIKAQYNLKGQIRTNSNIMCEMIFTSDKAFFEQITSEESKRYFIESYNFISSYKNLGEQNIISAVVHLDEEVPHMHLLFIPVVHTTDKQGNPIDKVCCRDYWQGKNSYRDLQNAYYKHITEKGFKLERGELVEGTNRNHYSIQEYKKLTNYENTKEIINNIKLELPKTPNIKDIKKIMINRDEKIMNEIIKPKDTLIQELYKDNLSLHKELSKQTNLVEKAEIFEKEKYNLNTAHIELQHKCNQLEDKLLFTEKNYEDEITLLKRNHQREVSKLETQIQKFEKVLSNIKSTFKDLVSWVCEKLSIQHENDIIREFEKDTGNDIDINKNFEISQSEQEYDIEL